MPRSPRIARALLHRTLPPDVREGIVGDLDELFERRSAHGTALGARLWYWTQALAIAARFTPERVSGLTRRFGASVGLDVRLGVRMLFKYPMLTAVGSVAITVAATISVGASEFVRDLWIPTLPIEEGERVVQLYQRDEESSGVLAPSLFDYTAWSESLESIEDLAAFQTQEQGLVGPQGQVGTVSLARVTASTFRMTRVPAARGRFLTPEDERPGAPPVVVLGHDAWQELLEGDPEAVGSTVELGGLPTTVIGVMPEGFGFPMNETAWVPLPVDEASSDPASSPRVRVAGRLAADASLESAEAELSARGSATAQAFPTTHARLQPQVAPYHQFMGGTDLLGWATFGVRVLLVFLLVAICANVATLVFARTVTREGEIAVRMSLGASRRRIVLQLFTEALVLVSVATLLAVVIVRAALGRIGQLFFTVQQEPTPPFWWNDDISTPTLVYAGVLTLVGAVLIGVVPALKATSGAVQARLSQLSSGAGGLRFGGMWTAVIVFQVALSVAFVPLAVAQGDVLFGRPLIASTFPATEYVTAQLGRDVSAPPSSDPERAELAESSRRLFEEVARDLAADPLVEGVAFASGLSAMNHVGAPVEFVGDGSEPPLVGVARTLLVDANYLELMGAGVVAGRGLEPGDLVPGTRAVVVNEAFVEAFLAGRNAVGGELRYPERPGYGEVTVPAVGSSFEVVGVVENPGLDEYGPGAHPAVYAPLSLAPVDARAPGLVGMPSGPVTQLFVRVRPGAETIAPRLYAVVSGVDPSLRLAELGTVEQAWGPARRGENLAAWIFLGVAGMVLMLSVAGIYALMSFTVSQRTREIAIRASVGAGPGRIVRTIFGRAFLQLSLGVALGSLIAIPALRAAEGPSVLLAVVAIMGSAGLAACLVPIRRALRIQPTDAIKST